MLVAEVFFNVAVVVRVVGGFWSNLDPRRTDAARMLGASRCACVSRGHPAVARTADRGRGLDRLPLHVHGVRCRAAPRRSRARDARGGDLPPGGRAVRPARSPPRSRSCRWSRSSRCSSVLARMQERRAVTQRLVAARDTARRPRGSRAAGSSPACSGSPTLFLGGPLAVLAVESLRVGGDWSLAAYRALGNRTATDTLFVPASEALVNSLVFAGDRRVHRRGRRRAWPRWSIASRPGRATRAMDTRR